MPKQSTTASRDNASHDSFQTWIDQWLDSIQSGAQTMSQRSLPRIEQRGSLGLLRRAARARGIHLLQLTSESGTEVIVGSLHPFKVIC